MRFKTYKMTPAEKMKLSRPELIGTLQQQLVAGIDRVSNLGKTVAAMGWVLALVGTIAGIALALAKSADGNSHPFVVVGIAIAFSGWLQAYVLNLIGEYARMKATEVAINNPTA